LADKKHLGHAGEEAAARYLESQGYTVLARNFRTRLGEIDLIAREGPTLCFIEVKTRSSQAFGAPAEAVNTPKQQKMAHVASQYLAQQPQERPCRFDVVEVYLSGQQAIVSRLIRGAFVIEEE